MFKFPFHWYESFISERALILEWNVAKMIVRLMVDKDYEAVRGIFKNVYAEYLEFLRLKHPKQYLAERRERREVTRERFNFYLKTGSSFVAEKDGEVIGFVTSQTAQFMHGVDKLLWIEYIAVLPEFRRQGIGFALLRRIIECAERTGINLVYTTINPDNEASIKLHLKAGFNVKSWKVASRHFNGSYANTCGL